MRRLTKEIILLGNLSNAFGPSAAEEDVREILKKELKRYAEKKSLLTSLATCSSIIKAEKANLD